MKSNYKDKMVGAGESQNKAKGLVCRASCDVRIGEGIRMFTHGDVVTDPKLVGELSGNPNFVKIEEGK